MMDNNFEEDGLKREQNINVRISKLYGESSYSNISKKEMTEEEKKNFRKNIIIIMWVLFLGGFLLILSLFMPNFRNKKENYVPIIEQNNTSEIPDGIVSINNKLIEQLDSMFLINNSHPLYDDNILKLYDKNLNVNNLDFHSQMLLVTSTEKFNKFMLETTKLNKYNQENEQNAIIKFSKESLENIVKQVLGDDVNIEHQTFKYYYSFSKEQTVYFEVVFENNEYFLEPIEEVESELAVYKKLVEAYKLGNEYYLEYKILFTNKSGIYSDKNMKTLVSKDFDKLAEVISNGVSLTITFEKVFDKDGNARYVFKTFDSIDNVGRGE